MSHLSASFSATVRVRIEDRPGSFARLAAAVGETGATLGAIDLVSAERVTKVRDVTVLAADATHLARVVDAMRAVDGTEVLTVSDRTFQLHEGGKIEVVAKTPLKTREDLSMVYTPGVARVSQAIADDPAESLDADDARRTWSPWSPTARPYSGWATSDRRPHCR